MGKQVLFSVGETTCAVGSVGLGGRKYVSDSVPVILKKRCPKTSIEVIMLILIYKDY